MRPNPGGVLNISYTDADRIDRIRLTKAFRHLRYTPEGVDVVLASMLEGDANYTGFTFTGRPRQGLNPRAADATTARQPR